MEVGFRSGSKGFIVRQIQQALGLSADGCFGPRTTAAISSVQQSHSPTAAGLADKQTFCGLGLQWPDEFTRCINLTSVLEGTSFGDCNSTDIDGAGLTLGIAGFTTAHGEVQLILGSLISRTTEALSAVPAALRPEFVRLLKTGGKPDEWERLFFTHDGIVLPQWRNAFQVWGSIPAMQEIQLQLARERFWLPSIRVARRLRLSSPRGRALLLDIAVQNGGWAARHQRVYDSLIQPSPSSDEFQRLEIMARSVAACAQPKWREDVLARKVLFARGAGIVHGDTFELRDYAIQ
jgi:hypothetical protein